MTAERLFSIVNAAALAAWLPLVFLPRARWATRVVPVVVPVLLAVVYVALNALNHGLTDPVRLVGVPTLVALLCGFGLVLGAAGSGLTLRRFLRV